MSVINWKILRPERAIVKEGGWWSRFDDEEVGNASILAPTTVADIHLDGFLVYHTHFVDLAVCILEVPI